MTLANRRIEPATPLHPPEHEVAAEKHIGAATTRPVILVVEDDTLLRMHAAEMIDEAGFEVIEAHNADAAMLLLKSRSDIAILFTDIDMPGSMNGLKLAQAVAGSWPQIGIVATSGHFQMRDGDLPAGGRFLPKPYRSHQILGVLHELAEIGS